MSIYDYPSHDMENENLEPVPGQEVPSEDGVIKKMIKKIFGSKGDSAQ